eukprot:5589960-Alexandrium_andersonii.AAC.1
MDAEQATQLLENGPLSNAMFENFGNANTGIGIHASEVLDGEAKDNKHDKQQKRRKPKDGNTTQA